MERKSKRKRERKGCVCVREKWYIWGKERKLMGEKRKVCEKGKV